MPTAVLEIDSSPLAGLARRLGQVDAEKRDALEAIGAAWVSTTQRRFQTSKAPDGTAWKPSLRVLRGRKKGGPTLVLRKNLRDSITSVVEGNTVQVGTNRVYGPAHQFGAEIQRSGAHAVPLFLPAGRKGGGVTLIPARPFLGVEAEDLTNWTEILEGFVAGATGAEA